MLAKRLFLTDSRLEAAATRSLSRKSSFSRCPAFARLPKRSTENVGNWRNAKHGAQWLSTLRQYAFPEIGELQVDSIGSPEILKVLAPIWLTKPETARRVRRRIGTVMDWARAAGHRDGENPITGVARGLPKQTDRATHHAALPFKDVPAFITRLRNQPADPITLFAFEFLILTAARTGEVVGAKWAEFDLEERIWTVPASRMKAKREHRVPLCDRAIELLEHAKAQGRDSAFVFPGRLKTIPLSNMAFIMTLRRMAMAVTAHGFRSSFRDWAAEATNFPRDIAEMALAHTIDSKVEAAYRRGDLLEIVFGPGDPFGNVSRCSVDLKIHTGLSLQDLISQVPCNIRLKRALNVRNSCIGVASPRSIPKVTTPGPSMRSWVSRSLVFRRPD